MEYYTLVELVDGVIKLTKVSSSRPRRTKSAPRSRRGKTRLEKAREILIRIRALDEKHGRWLPSGGVPPGLRVRAVNTGESWDAWISTGFDRLPDPRGSSYQQALQRQATPPRLRYLLDVWAVGEHKLMSVEYDQDELRLISFKPGDWPKRIFGVD